MTELLDAGKDKALRNLVQTIQRREKKTREEQIVAGRLLIEARSKAKQGEWHSWLKDRNISPRTADFWMSEAGYKSAIADLGTKSCAPPTTKTGKLPVIPPPPASLPSVIEVLDLCKAIHKTAAYIERYMDKMDIDSLDMIVDEAQDLINTIRKHKTTRKQEVLASQITLKVVGG